MKLCDEIPFYLDKSFIAFVGQSLGKVKRIMAETGNLENILKSKAYD